MTIREKISQARRVVVKLGTQIVVGDDGALDHACLSALVTQCAALVAGGKSVLLVSSGAVGLGRQVLGLGVQKLALSEKQACAAVGQTMLMNHYRELFHHHGLVTAQLLLTAFDFSDRQRYLNLRDTMERLLEFGVVPIINENDSVSISELQEDKTRSFGDNDKLSALVASKLGADLLVILTNVDGIYTDNPAHNPNAQRLTVIEGFESLADIGTEGTSALGRGGMATKVEAAKIAAMSGVHTIIASGNTPQVLQRVFETPEEVGTLVLAKAGISGRKRWLGLASGYEGVVVVNEGAKRALVERFASLLPSGVVAVQGGFAARQVVSLQDEHGEELGRGLVNFSAEDIRRIQGRQSQEIPAILGPVESDVVIQRDNLVIFEENPR